MITQRDITIHGHLGELLQGRLGPGGPVILQTLPCSALSMRAQWRPGAFALHQPARPVLTPAQAAAMLRALNLPVSGRFTLRADMPLGGGAGSSTSALLAIARLADPSMTDAQSLARAAISVEGASDPLMFAEPGRVLWASRIGQVMAHLPPLPRLDAIGGFFGPARRTNPADSDFPDVSDLAEALPAAMTRAEGLAQLASESARRSLTARNAADTPADAPADPCADLARDLGALGIAIGHTGPARALLFAPGRVPAHARAALREAGLRQIIAFRP